ncbi:MAG TPA: hypothetical protein VJM08_01725 [Anaerolineales bacterium]|nr:hypothetical protein [Anaerolineales bacterium]
MKFDFETVLTRAGQITWRYKNLWLAGIAISLVSLLLAPIILAFSSFAAPSEVNQQLPSMMLANVTAILLAILSIPIFVIAISIPSLGTFQVEQGSENVRFGQLVRGVLPYFWRVSGIVLLVSGGMFLAVLMLIVFAFSISVLTMGIGLLCIFPLLILIIMMVILGYALMEQAVSAVLVDNLRVSSALQRAWELVMKNPGLMTLMSLINYVGAIVAILIILSILTTLPMFGSEPDIQSFRNMMWMLAFLPFYVVFQGVLVTSFQSVWTLIYLRLTRGSTSQPVLPETAPS